jgi:hypothetical protein
MYQSGSGKVAVLVLGLILIIGSLAVLCAAEETSAETASYFELLEPYVSLYNENIGSIPDLAKRVFDGERINVHIGLDDGGEEILGVATSKGECAITEFTAGGLDQPTLRVYIEGAVIERHMADPVQDEIIDTVVNLKIEGVGFLNQIKVFVFGLIQKVARLFA